MQRIVLSLVLFSLPVSVATAAEWSEAQAAVWQFVEQSWVDDAGETGKWPGEYVHPEVLNWDSDWPVPRGLSSMSKWTKMRDSRTELVAYELFPHDILVKGDTAVVFYTVVDVRTGPDGKAERDVGGVVETLVREGGSWKYLALTGFETDSDD